MRIAGGPGTCWCGCGEPVAKGRDFRMGHDQRFRGALMRAHLAGELVDLPAGESPITAMALANRFGASWHDSLVLAERKKRAAIAELLQAAAKEKRQHKVGKNLKVGWEVCVITQLKTGGQEVRYVDVQGKKGRVNVPPKEELV